MVAGHACRARYAKDVWCFPEHTPHTRPRGARPRDRSRKMPHFVVFCPWWPWPLTFDPQIRTWARLLYNAPNRQVFHYPRFNRSGAIVLTNKQTNWQTNRRRWKHPPRSAMLRPWVKMEKMGNTIIYAAFCLNKRQLVVLSATALWDWDDCLFMNHVQSIAWSPSAATQSPLADRQSRQCKQPSRYLANYSSVLPPTLDGDARKHAVLAVWAKNCQINISRCWSSTCLMSGETFNCWKFSLLLSHVMKE